MGRPWNILLVEDDEDDYVITRDLLSESKGNQFDLDWYSTFATALEACLRNSYDACLVDYRLGKQDGLELARQAVKQGCTAPIILLTGQGSYEVDVEAMKIGVKDYLVKGDLNSSILERTIRYAIERKQTEDTLQKARDELEIRVQERTQELRQANECLAITNEELRAEIAERQRMEDALRRSENRFRKLAETTSSAIFIVQDFKIRYANTAVKMMTGFEPDELLNVDFWEIAHPAYREVLKRSGLAGTWSTGVPARYELKLLTKNNVERWVDVTVGSLEFEGLQSLVVTAFDITERDLAEQALRKAKADLETSVAERTADLRRANEKLAQANQKLAFEAEVLKTERAKLSAIIANAPEAIVVTDKDSRVVLANPAAERLYGRPVPIGMDFGAQAEYQLYYPDGTACQPGDSPLVRSVQEGETLLNLEMAIIQPGRQRRDLLVSSTPILDYLGIPSGAIAIFQDITQRKINEEEIRRDAAQIEVQHLLIQYREIERLHIAQELHDGPLQELIGITFAMTDLLQIASINNPQNEAFLIKLSTIQERLKQQIRDLRLYCSELRPPTLVPFGLEKAIRSHAETFRDRNPGLKIRLELSPDSQQLPEKIRLALFRIYQELLNNIVRHAHATDVVVRFSLDDSQAVLKVEDDGNGFEVPKTWIELARQGHLGLVGVQERAEAAGGSMSIVSYPGNGTRVQVSIPRNSPREPDLFDRKQNQVTPNRSQSL